MNRDMLRHGFVLLLLALIFGLFVPNMAIPRLGLSAHTIGVLSAVLLIGIGAIWPQFMLSARQATVMYWAWLLSSYLNWLACLTGAIFGAGRMTPLAAAGVEGGAGAELAVAAMLASVAVASFVAVGLSLWGLRGRAAVTP